MNSSATITTVRRHLFGHGALILFFGGAVGFAFLFFLLGEVRLWPFFRFEYQLPGSYKAWRMTHLEGIINGFALWLAAVALPMMHLSDKIVRRIGNGLIIVAWTFTVASLLDALFPESRGLYFGGPLSNKVAFFMFYVGVLIFMITVAYIAWKSLRGKPESTTP